MSEIASQLKQANEKVDSWWRSLLKAVHVSHGTTRMLALVCLAFIVFTILAPNVFLSTLNVQNMLLAVPETGLLAIAMMVAMLTGGIDLSLVAIANLTAITISTTYSALEANNPGQGEAIWPLIVLLGIAVGIGAGVVNAVLISIVGVTPILATLGTMQIFNGLAVVWTGGKTLYGSPQALTVFGQTAYAGIPALFYVFVIVTLFVAFILVKAPLGLRLELEGSNPVASRYSGIKSRSILFRSYVLTGLIGAIAGIVFIARNPTASADYGASYTLLVIVIAVLGGTNPMGGFASASGVFLAALTLQIVQSGFTALRLGQFQYAIAQGVILIVVLVLEQVNWNEKLRKFRRGSAEASLR